MVKDQPSDAQLKFRVSKPLRERLEQAAKKNGGSLNKEVVDRLTRSLDQGAGDFDETKPGYGILKLLDRVMNAAGESALFARTHSWDLARQMSWTEDDFAYEQATTAASQVLQALKPVARSALLESPGVWDGQFWAEFFLHQIASGKANVPGNQAMIESLRSSLGTLTVRLASFSEVDPDERPRARAREHLAKGRGEKRK